MRNKTESGIVTPEKSKSIFSGVFVLLLSNLIVKVVGLFFKIPISYLLSDEGMGYFNSAYTIYTWLYILSTAGVPVAVSIMVSSALARGEWGLARRYRSVALRAFAVIGAAGAFLLAAFAAPVARLVGSPDACYAILAIAPTLLFVCISSVLRGDNQGQNNMVPTALSQVIESVGKLMPGILLAYLAAKRGLGLPAIAAWAVLGVTAGALMSMLYLSVVGHVRKKKYPHTEMSGLPLPFGRALRDIMRIAIPITVSASVMSLTNLIDLAIMMRRLQGIGYTAAQATALYGNYTTLVVPLFNLPTVLIYPIAYTVVPRIASSLSAGQAEQGKEIAGLSLRLTTALAMPCAVGMGVFSYPILSMIFKENSASLAAPYLAVVSPAVVFICILAVTNSLLQAYGQQNKPIFSMLAGCAVKLLCGYVLMGIPSVGMMGAPVGTLLCYITVGCMNLFFVSKYVGVMPPIRQLILMPLFASAASVFLARLAYGYLQPLLPAAAATAGAIALAAFLYLLFALLLGILRTDDFRRIPVFDKLLGKFPFKKAKSTSKSL